MPRSETSLRAERLFNERLLAVSGCRWQDSSLFAEDDLLPDSSMLTLVVRDPEAVPFVFMFDEIFSIGMPEFGGLIEVSAADFDDPKNGVARSASLALLSSVELLCARWSGFVRVRFFNTSGDLLLKSWSLQQSSSGMARGEERSFRPVLADPDGNGA